MGLYKIVRSKGYKNFMAKLYGWGASAVIAGALFKILHLPFADYMLMVGMGTEALIFFFSAFEPLHKEYDWALVYPELGQPEGAKLPPQGTVTQQLDRMLEEAKIGPALIESLSSGMRNLSDTAKNLSKTTDAVNATEGYAANLTKAKDAVQTLTGVYEKSANDIAGTANQQVKSIQEMIDAQKQHTHKMQESFSATADMQMKGVKEMVDAQKQHAQKLQESLSATSDMQTKGAQELFEVQKQHAQKLQNTLTSTSDLQVKSIQEMYDMQKQHAQKLQDVHVQNVQKIGQIQEQGTQAIMDNYKKIQDNSATLANAMNDTAQEAHKYKQEVDKLSKNVAQINSIYANMLAAMTNK